jgi:cell wall-associated NlpC family hydrolase
VVNYYERLQGTLKKGAFCFRRCNLKKIAILGTVVVLLGCSTATVADGHKASFITKQVVAQPSNLFSQIIHTAQVNTMLEQQAAKAAAERQAKAKAEAALQKNRKILSDQVDKLHSYVGKTWYVFSGSSPRGWDCSGLTRWFYMDLGIELEHSASKQGKYAGYHVDTPNVGDIVAFSHMSSSKYYHVGIYIGNNEIIHAGFKPGRKTEVISLDSPSFKNSEITFVRVIEN